MLAEHEILPLWDSPGLTASRILTATVNPSATDDMVSMVNLGSSEAMSTPLCCHWIRRSGLPVALQMNWRGRRSVSFGWMIRS